MVVARTVLPTMFMPMYMYTKCILLSPLSYIGHMCAVNGALVQTDPVWLNGSFVIRLSRTGWVEWFFR